MISSIRNSRKRTLSIFETAITVIQKKCFVNLDYKTIFEHEMTYSISTLFEDTIRTYDNVICKYTGEFTGRSPKDKYFVDDGTDRGIAWGEINQKMKPETFHIIYSKVLEYYEKKVENPYVFFGKCGSSDKHGKIIKLVSKYPWQHHFAKNMFIEIDYIPDPKDIDFTIWNASDMTFSEWESYEMNSENFVTFDLDSKVCLIGGTSYHGEMKKGMFSVMNQDLPRKGVLTMHCAANMSCDGDTALFFGLSGTGKTSLSVDKASDRLLIGDDEHGWDETGVFNLEGGCYAKTYNLDPEKEPVINNCIKPNALMENVKVNPITNKPDYFDTSITENGRVSYPLEFIEDRVPENKGGHPSKVIFLTCDAFGVLPRVAKLTSEQAHYYFLQGYTAKVPGTERGITEPQATFSSCFGEAFLPLDPVVYADLLVEKLKEHGSDVYLVNTGWMGGQYGVGERVPMEYTRTIIRRLLANEIPENAWVKDGEPNIEKYFKLNLPTHIEGIPTGVLNPIDSWQDTENYIDVTVDLLDKFKINYQRFDRD